jgi:hypothetical protein
MTDSPTSSPTASPTSSPTSSPTTYSDICINETIDNEQFWENVLSLFTNNDYEPNSSINYTLNLTDLDCIHIYLGGNGYAEETVYISSDNSFEIIKLENNSNYNYSVDFLNFISMNKSCTKKLSIIINNNDSHWNDFDNSKIIIKPKIENQTFIISGFSTSDDDSYYSYDDDLYINIFQNGISLINNLVIPTSSPTLSPTSSPTSSNPIPSYNYEIKEGIPSTGDFLNIIPSNNGAGNQTIDIYFNTNMSSSSNVKIYLGGNHWGGSYYDNEQIQILNSNETKIDGLNLMTHLNNLEDITPRSKEFYENIINTRYIINTNDIISFDSPYYEEQINSWYEDTSKTDPPIQLIIDDNLIYQNTRYMIRITSDWDDDGTDIFICVKQDNQIIHEIINSSVIINPSIENKSPWIYLYKQVFNSMSHNININNNTFWWKFTPNNYTNDILIYLSGNGIQNENDIIQIEFYEESEVDGTIEAFNDYDAILKDNYYDVLEPRKGAPKKIKISYKIFPPKFWIEDVFLTSGIIIQNKYLTSEKNFKIKSYIGNYQNNDLINNYLSISLKQKKNIGDDYDFITIYPIFELSSGWHIISIPDIYHNYTPNNLKQYGLNYNNNSIRLFDKDTNTYKIINDDEKLQSNLGYWINIK